MILMFKSYTSWCVRELELELELEVGLHNMKL